MPEGDPVREGGQKQPYRFLKAPEMDAIFEGRLQKINAGITKDDWTHYYPGGYRDFLRPHIARRKMFDDVGDFFKGPQADITDQDFFDVVQIGVHKLDFFLQNTIGSFPLFLMQGVKGRAIDNPDFKQIFNQFAVDLYQNTEKPGKWESLLKTDPFFIEATNKIAIAKRRFPMEGVINRLAAERASSTNKKDAYRSFIAGPGIVLKDTEELLEVTDRLSIDSPIEVLGIKSQRALSVTGYDLFRYTVGEASDLGWGNAKSLANAHDKLTKQGLEPEGIIIHLSNMVVESLNKQNFMEGGMRFEKLNPLDINNVQEALNRCMYVIFELGQKPDHDPINFLLSAEVSAALFSAAAVVDKDPIVGKDESRIESQARAYRELRQNQGSSVFWKRWKNGYGLLS